MQGTHITWVWQWLLVFFASKAEEWIIITALLLINYLYLCAWANQRPQALSDRGGVCASSPWTFPAVPEVVCLCVQPLDLCSRDRARGVCASSPWTSAAVPVSSVFVRPAIAILLCFWCVVCEPSYREPSLFDVFLSASNANCAIVFLQPTPLVWS